MSPPSFPAPLQRSFTERLVTHQDASAHTVAAYRDTFRLLLPFVHAGVGRAPSALRLDDLDAPCLEGFLLHLERDRHNHPRTRNQRLAALRGLFRYVALQEPAYSLHCQRGLYPRETIRAWTRGVSHRRRDGRARRRAGPPHHVGRPARSDAAPRRGPDRPAEWRADGAPATGCRPRRGRAHSVCGERPKGPRHAVAAGCRRRARRLARAPVRRTARPRVSERARRPPQC